MLLLHHTRIVQHTGIEPVLNFRSLIKSQEPNLSANVAFVGPEGFEPS